MGRVDFISEIHRKTPRNYRQKVIEYDKAECARVAKQFGRAYFDGERQHGYGGFRYDGRWRPFARKLIEYYKLKPGDKILDIGCAKGFLLNDLMEALPGVEIAGIDISDYAIQNAMDRVKPFLKVTSATNLPFQDQSFDLILSINTLHNLYNYQFAQAISEIERVGKSAKKYIVVDSYRNEDEKVNLLYWQTTCECFYTPKEWEWLLNQCGYRGDYDFVFFE